MNKKILFGLVLSLVIFGSAFSEKVEAQDNASLNYVWNDTCSGNDCWIPWLANTEGRPKVDINLLNLSAENASIKDSVLSDYIFPRDDTFTRIDNVTIYKDLRVLGNSYLGSITFDSNGTIPDSLLTDYIYPESETVTKLKNITVLQDVHILGTLYGGSPLSIGGGINLTGNITDVNGNVVLSNDDTGNLTVANDLIVDGNSYLGSFRINNALTVGSNNFSSTRIGIGTLSPDTTLDVEGPINVSGDIIFDAVSRKIGYDEFTFLGNSGGNKWRLVAAGDASINIDSNNDGSSASLTIRSNDPAIDGGTEIARFEEGGNVGIGTSSPNSGTKLHIEAGNATDTFPSGSDDLIVENNAGGGITLANPSSANSVISFGDETDNNVGQIIYQHTADRLDFTVNAANAMVIDSSQQIGIGTTSPRTLFHLEAGSPILTIDAQESTGDPRLDFESDTYNWSMGIDTSASDNFVIAESLGVGSGQVMSFTTGGNVGIGTTSPTHKLNVVGTGNITSDLYVEDEIVTGLGASTANAGSIVISNGTGNANTFLFLQQDTTTKAAIGWDGANQILKINGDSASFGSTHHLTIDSSGNVGIGTTSPTTTLDVVGNLNVTSGEANIDNLDLDGNTITSLKSGITVQPTTDEDLTLQTPTGSNGGDTGDVLIQSGAGINANSGEITIQVAEMNTGLGNGGSVTIKAGNNSGYAGGGGITAGSVNIRGGSTNSAVNNNKQAGSINLQVGYNDADSARNGNLNFQYFSNGWTNTMQINGNTGDICDPGTDADLTDCASDARLKTNINNYPYGLNEILQIRPVQFSWNELGAEKFNQEINKTRTGLIAQEVETIIPDWVKTRTDGYKFVPGAGDMELVLVNAIQEQQQIIESQNERIEILEQQILKQ